MGDSRRYSLKQSISEHIIPYTGLENVWFISLFHVTCLLRHVEKLHEFSILFAQKMFKSTESRRTWISSLLFSEICYDTLPNGIYLPTRIYLLKNNNSEMDVMKFRDNTKVCGCTIVCGCTTKITLIHGVMKLNYGIRLEYCKDCVCDLLQILNLWMWPA